MMPKDVKRSISIHGHRTSISLEPEFWDCFQVLARAEGLSVAKLVQRIDEARDGGNLSSAIRVHILKELQNSSRRQ
jgi:predicted DNA-binding ribbon-helix-helix protein